MRANTMVIIDLETSGLDPEVHGVHQIAAVRMVHEAGGWWYLDKAGPAPTFSRHVTLPRDREWHEGAGLGGVTEQEARQESGQRVSALQGLEDLVRWLRGFHDPYDPLDKSWLAEWGNRFDSNFLHAWWAHTKLQPNINRHSSVFSPGNFFHRPGINLLSVCQFLHSCNGSPDQGRWRLEDVAERLDLDFDPSQLHDALYDVKLTAKVLTATQEHYYRLEAAR